MLAISDTLLLLLLMYRHGLRVSEAINLKAADLDLDHARLWVKRLKGGLSAACHQTIPVCEKEFLALAVLGGLRIKEPGLPKITIDTVIEPMPS